MVKNIQNTEGGIKTDKTLKKEKKNVSENK
jgi:hypothetical protein